MLPHAGLRHVAEARALSSPLLLAGIRDGMRLGDVGVGRAPSWFNCEEVLSDGLELPLRPRELRVFTDPAAQQAPAPRAARPGRDLPPRGRAILCGRDVAMPDGRAVPAPGRGAASP